MAQEDINEFFLLINAFIIFFMHCGYAFRQCGSIRNKNATSILLRNFLDIFLGMIMYWLLGYAFQFGSGNAFIGSEHFGLYKFADTLYAFFFFHFAVGLSMTSIVTGAMAERCEIAAYVTYTCVITGFLYPVVSHWAWAQDGFLHVGISYDEGNSTTVFQDFAGSGVVHLTGGVSALVGTFLLGPRLGRFKDDGTSVTINGHSMPLTALGGFILLLGFLAFNGGSHLTIGDSDGPVVAQIVINTVICGSLGGVVNLYATALCAYRKEGKFRWSLLSSLNGALTGMVASCAGCNVMEPWGAALTGALAGLLYLALSSLLLKLRIDDPVETVAVHAGGGFLGLIATPFLDKFSGVFYLRDRASGFYLGWNLVGGAAIIAWSGFVSALMFGFLKFLGHFRVSEEAELNGIDVMKLGEPAYPESREDASNTESSPLTTQIRRIANMAAHSSTSAISYGTLVEENAKQTTSS